MGYVIVELSVTFDHSTPDAGSSWRRGLEALHSIPALPIRDEVPLEKPLP